MQGNESIKDIPPVWEGGPSASELLPTEVTNQTEMGQFAATVLDLVERQTGLPVSDREALFDFSTQVESYGIPLVGSTENGEWLVSGYKGQSPGSSQTLPGSPMTHIEIGHVAAWRPNSQPIYDQLLKVELVGDPSGENKGTVWYEEKSSDQGQTKTVTDLRVGDSRIVNQNKEDAQKIIVLEGDRPGINEAKEIPQVIGHFIDNLPQKSNFTPAQKGSSAAGARRVSK